MKAILLGTATVLALGAAAAAQSITVVDEIRYPTSYREQSVESMIDTGYRAPIPDAFETRRVGVDYRVAQVGVVGKTVIVKNPPSTFTVVFPEGHEAQFIDGQTTVVKGVPYRGAGFRYGMYRVINMLNGDVVYFKKPSAK